MIKKVIVTLVFISLMTSGYRKPDVYTIDAEKNAILHNSLGLNAVCDKNYLGAIQEFSLAILLNPKTQATSVYYNNLGETYMKIGYYKDAQKCFEMALKQYSLNFLYYQNLVDSFKAQGVLASKLNYYKSKGEKNPLNMIMIGLLYIANGDKRSGIIKLDEFCLAEPDLLITQAVRSYLQGVIPKY